ncbi:hypothetical protein K0038_05183 [Pseudomonas syringae]|uniref:ankyrin repeat domain-containing protein n=1 Tax=Pseudomonadota TaxID=1224 RepID=UPI0002FC33D7|nr:MULTISPECIES: ankyrin repeat domain-containing protein [Pseudomonadota]KHO02231.1 hypothetical protein JS61_07780 [Rickettsia felis]MCI3948062.1 hypothetical protein [Pseudomonas syringae]MDE8611957.1 ankyrin repeat domain-containing protein [Rickettsia felis]
MQNLTKEQTLIEAIKQGDFYNVLDLVSQGVDLNFHDENLDTVFSIAAHYGQIKILEYLAANMKKNTHRHIDLSSNH